MHKRLLIAKGEGCRNDGVLREANAELEELLATTREQLEGKKVERIERTDFLMILILNRYTTKVISVHSYEVLTLNELHEYQSFIL